MWITNYHFSLSLCLSDICLFSSYFIYLLTSKNSPFYFIMYMYSHCVGSITVDLMYPYISSSHLHYFMCNTRYYYFIVLCSINLNFICTPDICWLGTRLQSPFTFFYELHLFLLCITCVCIKAFCDHVDNDFYSHLIRYNDIQ